MATASTDVFSLLSPTALRERLADVLRQPAQRLFLLFDSAAHESLPSLFFASRSTHRYEILPLEWAESTLPLLPFLVELPDRQECEDPFLDWMLEQGSQHEACMLMAASVDFETLVAHWRHLLHARLPDGRILHLRLFDARVAKRLLADEATTADLSLLGPVAKLWLPSGSTTWHEVTNPKPQAIDWQQVEYPWVRLTDAQVERLNANATAALFGRVRHFLWQHHSHLFAQYPLAQSDRMIRIGLARALELEFSSLYAAGNFVALALVFGFGWISLPSIQTVLKNKPGPDQRMDALLKIPNAQWQSFVSPEQAQREWQTLLTH